MTSNRAIYPPRAACAAANLSYGTLATWTTRGLLRNLDASRLPETDARLFSRADILALALMKTAADAGLGSVKVLSECAHLAAEDYLADPCAPHSLTISRVHDGHKASTHVTYDQAMDGPGILVKMSFELHGIFGQALSKLNG